MLLIDCGITSNYLAQHTTSAPILKSGFVSNHLSFATNLLMTESLGLHSFSIPLLDNSVAQDFS
jgi:hypothetical protein